MPFWKKASEKKNLSLARHTDKEPLQELLAHLLSIELRLMKFIGAFCINSYTLKYFLLFLHAAFACFAWVFVLRLRRAAA